jgi:choice-of-anchor B domain-containing protein
MRFRPGATLILLSILPANSIAQVTTRNATLLAHVNEYGVAAPGQAYAYSACWSYVHSDGREYAVIGTSTGTAIYRVSNPSSPIKVGFVPGPPSIWREMKQYGNWIYVVSEGHGAGEGLQIIRMTNPQQPVLAATYTANGTLASAHTVTVDSTRALLVLNGTKNDAGNNSDYYYTGMRVFSLANPEAPVEIGAWPAGVPFTDQNYVHDAVVRDGRLYAARVYAQTLDVLDFTNPAAPTSIASWTYPGAYYTHNSWPDASGRYLYVTDEHNGETLRIFDIADLANPILVNGLSCNPVAIVHNAHVRGNELYLSNYTEGIRFLDLADPVHPAEFGWADSYPGPSGGYGGVWEVCPFFPSGIVIASDMQTGLYVYRPVRNYGLVKVTVKDELGQPLPGVRVRLTTQGDSLVTPADGTVQFAPSPGAHQVTVDRFGYGRASASVDVTAGSSGSVALTLALLPITSFAGAVHDQVSGAVLEGAEVDLDYTSLQSLTDASGAYHVDGVPEDDYRVEVHRPGYVPLTITRHIGLTTAGQDFRLTPATAWDPIETGAGWTAGAPGDDATGGAWVWAAPVGTGSAPAAALSSPASPARLAAPDATSAAFVLPRPTPSATSGCGDPSLATLSTRMCPTSPAVTAAARAGATASGAEPPGGHCGCGTNCLCGVLALQATSTQIKPWSDRTPGAGTHGFITGQAPSNNVDPDAYDLDGRTTLTSPAFDVRGLADPVLGWWRWFYSHDPETGQPEPSDWLAVLVSGDDGVTWTPVDTTRGLHNAWEEQAIHMAQYVTPSANVRVRFVAADQGHASTVEAGVDDISVYDGGLATVGVPGGDARVRFGTPSPNPFQERVALSLEIARNGAIAVDVLDVFGRRVRALHRDVATAGTLRLEWDGRNDRGTSVPAGVYFAEARMDGSSTRVRFIRMP